MNTNANKTPTFFLDVFQVCPNPRADVDVAYLYDELLETAHSLLGIVDGNIPDDSTITHAAKFLISAARAGYQTLGGAA